MKISCKICSCRLSNLDTHKIRMPIDGYVYRICNTCAEHLKRWAEMSEEEILKEMEGAKNENNS